MDARCPILAVPAIDVVLTVLGATLVMASEALDVACSVLKAADSIRSRENRRAALVSSTYTTIRIPTSTMSAISLIPETRPEPLVVSHVIAAMARVSTQRSRLCWELSSNHTCSSSTTVSGSIDHARVFAMVPRSALAVSIETS